VPTDAQRALVESASAFGITQAEIADQLKIDEKTLRKHFRDELSGGKFKVDMTAGKTLVELMKSRDERVRLEATKYYTARRGWKETNVNEQVGKDGGRIETKDVSAIDIIRVSAIRVVVRLVIICPHLRLVGASQFTEGDRDHRAAPNAL
jgi:hypothetical protein